MHVLLAFLGSTFSSPWMCPFSNPSRPRISQNPRPLLSIHLRWKSGQKDPHRSWGSRFKMASKSISRSRKKTTGQGEPLKSIKTFILLYPISFPAGCSHALRSLGGLVLHTNGRLLAFINTEETSARSGQENQFTFSQLFGSPGLRINSLHRESTIVTCHLRTLVHWRIGIK